MFHRLQKIITSPSFQKVFGTKPVSAIFGLLAESRLPRPVLRKLIAAYISAFKIDMADFDLDLAEVRSFNHFFTRRLKPGSRPVGKGIISPAEGFVAQKGLFENGMLLQVKGSEFGLRELLQVEPDFHAGSFITIYLSLGDYHRVHFPFDGMVEKISFIPGKLLATNPEALQRRKKIYCANERITFTGSSKYGRFHLILVGATCVGKIRLKLENLEFSSRKKKNIESILPLAMKKGEQFATFEMGSTVILIMDKIWPDIDLPTGERLKVNSTLVNLGEE